MKHLYILGTVLFTVYGQMIIKWRVSILGEIPDSLVAKVRYLVDCLTDLYILSGLTSAFVASLFWIGAMSVFPIGYAYPFMGLNFLIVSLLANLIFHEPFSTQQVIGTGLVIMGILFLGFSRT